MPGLYIKLQPLSQTPQQHPVSRGESLPLFNSQGSKLPFLQEGDAATVPPYEQEPKLCWKGSVLNHEFLST